MEILFLLMIVLPFVYGAFKRHESRVERSRERTLAFLEQRIAEEAKPRPKVANSEAEAEAEWKEGFLGDHIDWSAVSDVRVNPVIEWTDQMGEREGRGWRE